MALCKRWNGDQGTLKSAQVGMGDQGTLEPVQNGIFKTGNMETSTSLRDIGTCLPGFI